MAPEQLRGDALIDARADIYAFGHLAFAMLVGKPYFAVEHARSTSLYALLLQVAKGPPEPASARARSSGIELPPGFDAWFARATAPEPEDRFETAADAASRLGPALLALAPAPEAGARASARRRPIAAAALAAGLVVVGGSVFAIATRVNATAATPVTPLDPNAASLPAIAPPSAAPVEAMPSFPLVTAPSAAPAPPQAVVTARAPKRVATPPSTHRSKPPHDPLDSL
jgi:serine/threonine-protein kinase